MITALPAIKYAIDTKRPGRFAEGALHPPLRYSLYPYVAD
jgi:hypothetical protein